jgi:hypothetical protein
VPEQQQADAAWGHQDAFYEAHAAGGGDASVAAAAATTPQQKPQQLQPQQAEEHEEGEEAADHEGGSPAQLTGGPAEQDIEAEASSPPPAQQSAARLAAQAAEGDEAQPDADTGADASGAALWEHSDEGWQDLLQRACRGELAAVLACARELVHGGDFCLQDFGLARQLLHTVSVSSVNVWASGKQNFARGCNCSELGSSGSRVALAHVQPSFWVHATAAMHFSHVMAAAKAMTGAPPASHPCFVSCRRSSSPAAHPACGWASCVSGGWACLHLTLWRQPAGTAGARHWATWSVHRRWRSTTTMVWVSWLGPAVRVNSSNE